MFSEITAKLRIVTHSTRQSILINLIPWVYNLELVDNMIYGKKELPGRTLEFDFDFSPFSLSNSRHSSPTSGNKSGEDRISAFSPECR